MKRFLSILSLVILGFVSTSCYDDMELRESIEDLEGRVTTLETLCTELNSNITALNTLVQAMQKGDYVVSVSPLIEDGVEVGYRIVFKESGVVDLYHGKDGADGEDGNDGANGQDGANGTDGHTPVLGTKQDTDGAYYWTIDGEWVLDGEGNKIPLVTVGATPQLKIEDETWFVSYDDGKTWEELGAAVSVGIKDIKEENGELVITMADGTVIAVPLGSPMKVVLGEFDAASLNYGTDLEIPYTIEGVEGDVVVFLLKEGAAFEAELVEETALAGKVVVKQLAAAQTESKGKIGIFAVAEDGTTVSQAIRIVSGVFYAAEGNQESYEVEAAGGNVEFKVATNTTFEVKTSAEWITYVETKAVEEKTLTFAVAANEGEAREGSVEVISGETKLSFTIAQTGGYVAAPEESLVGMYKIQTFWVYGGTGPADGGAGWVDLHNKTWWFDEETGHGIAAERNNYLEFTLEGFNADNTQSTGKCINWAGTDGKNWSCWFHNSKINAGVPTDGNKYYRQIPIGESTWVRDYTVTPNTVTFTDAQGNKTVLEILEPGYQFVPGYGDKNAANNTRTFPRTEGDDLTFHAKITTGKDNWNAIYNEIDKVYDRPRDFFIDVNRVDEIPADAKTTEAKYTPALPEPEEPEVLETLAGTYKYSTDKVWGGPDGGVSVKGVYENYKEWGPMMNEVKTMLNDVYVFTVTGSDANGNETGVVTLQAGEDGTWDRVVKMDANTPYDATELYGFVDDQSTYVYDKTAGKITFTTREKEYVVDCLAPGTYTYAGKECNLDQSKYPYTFAMHYDMGYTGGRVAGYTNTGSGFARHYNWARDYVLYLVRQ